MSPSAHTFEAHPRADCDKARENQAVTYVKSLNYIVNCGGEVSNSKSDTLSVHDLEQDSWREIP